MLGAFDRAGKSWDEKHRPCPHIPGSDKTAYTQEEGPSAAEDGASPDVGASLVAGLGEVLHRQARASKLSVHGGTYTCGWGSGAASREVGMGIAMSCCYSPA